MIQKQRSYMIGKMRTAIDCIALVEKRLDDNRPLTQLELADLHYELREAERVIAIAADDLADMKPDP